MWLRKKNTLFYVTDLKKVKLVINKIYIYCGHDLDLKHTIEFDNEGEARVYFNKLYTKLHEAK